MKTHNKTLKIAILSTELSSYVMSLVTDLLMKFPESEITLFLSKEQNDNVAAVVRNTKEMGPFWVIQKIVTRCLLRFKFLGLVRRVAILKISSYDEIFQLKNIDVMIAYNTGIIKTNLFNFPKHGTICAHPAMLPLGRGIAGMDKAILNNDPFGVTVFRIDNGIDTGPIYFQKELDLEKFSSRKDLNNEISQLSVELTSLAVSSIKLGVPPTSQTCVHPYVTLTVSERAKAKALLFSKFLNKGSI